MANAQDRVKMMIVEDNQMFRDGLKAMLEFREDLEVVAEAGDGIEAYRMAQRAKPDLVLMDLSMPKMNGVGVIKDIKSLNPETMILVLTIHDSDDHLFGAFEAGADGYCLKDASRGELIMAIDSILSGKRFVSPGLSGQVLEGYLESSQQKQAQTPWDALSHRERQVLKLLAEGYQNREIAAYLHISSKTVEKHRSNIMKKLDLHNSAALASYAVEKGLLQKN